MPATIMKVLFEVQNFSDTQDRQIFSVMNMNENSPPNPQVILMLGTVYMYTYVLKKLNKERGQDVSSFSCLLTAAFISRLLLNK